MTDTNIYRLNYLLASNPAIIFACKADLSPGITYMSQNVEWILGYTVDEFYDDPMFWINNVHPDDRIAAKEKYPELLKLGKWVREYRFKHNDGNYRWMRDEIRVVFDDLGNAQEIVGTWLDVTEKRLAEERLARQQLIGNQFISIANAVFVMLDEHGLIVDINPFTLRALGYERHQVLGKNWYHNFVSPSKRVEKEWMFHNYLLNRQLPDNAIETNVITSSGQERIFTWRKMIVDGEDGKKFLICSGNDCTDDILAKGRLEESEALFRLIADNLTDIIWKNNPGGIINYTSPSIEKVLGYAQDELIGKDLSSLIHTDDIPAFREVHQQYVYGMIETAIETNRLLKKDGDYMWLETISKAIRGNNGELVEQVAISRDISLRKKLEAELEELAYLMQVIHKNLPVIIYRLNVDGIIRASFGKGLQRLGKRDHEYVGLDVYKEFPEFERQMRKATAEEYYSYESGGETMGQSWWFQNFYVRDKYNADSYIGFSIDITEQKLAQEELFRTKEMYRLLVNSFPKVAVFVFDKDIRFLYAEGQDLANNNFQTEMMVGKTYMELFPGGKEDRLYQMYMDAFIGISQVFDYESLGKIFQVHVTPVRDKMGKISAAISISRDITEERKMEQFLLKVSIEKNDLDRKVISEELHDNLGQKLASLKFQLESIDTRLFANNPEQNAIFEKAKATINNVFGQLRELANYLMPNPDFDS